MEKKYRLIVSFAEGDFMLWRDFDTMAAAFDYAMKVGFATFEASRDYDLREWELIDPSIDAENKLSFAYRKK